MATGDWLRRAGERANKRLQEIPVENLSPAGKLLRGIKDDKCPTCNYNRYEAERQFAKLNDRLAAAETKSELLEAGIKEMAHRWGTLINAKQIEAELQAILRSVGDEMHFKDCGVAGGWPHRASDCTT